MMPYIPVFMVCIFLIDKFKEKNHSFTIIMSDIIIICGFRDKNIGSDTDFTLIGYIRIRYIHNLIDLITIETERNLDKGYLFYTDCFLIVINIG